MHMIPSHTLPRLCRSAFACLRNLTIVSASSLIFAACSTGAAAPEEVAGPSSIVWVTDAYAGGQRVLDSTVVDSATGRWTVTRCGPVVATGPICRAADYRMTTGIVDTVFQRLLFQRVVRSDFVALLADYPQVGIVPPDLLVQQLNVTVNQRRQSIRWRSGSAAPVTVGSFTCLLQQSMGIPILCAN
jgi:hypothetical protein